MDDKEVPHLYMKYCECNHVSHVPNLMHANMEDNDRLAVHMGSGL